MTTAFTLNVDQCIERAIAFSGGQPSQFEELQSARENLNLLFQEWSTQNINLWKVDFVNVTLAASTVNVSLSSDVIRPIHIAVAYGSAPSSDLAMTPISYTDYNSLPKKDTGGRPVQYLVQRQKDQTNLKLWPVPETQAVLKMCVLRKFDDVTSPLDSVDAPARFLPALTYGLAYRLALARSNGTQEWEAKLNRLEKEAMRTWQIATDDDDDNVSMTIVPKVR